MSALAGERTCVYAGADPGALCVCVRACVRACVCMCTYVAMSPPQTFVKFFFSGAYQCISG